MSALPITRTPPGSAESTPRQNEAARRVCIVGEDLSGSPDEGVKNFTLALAQALDKQHNLLLLSTEGVAALPYACLAPAPRTFLSSRLRTRLARHRPEVVLYVARSSTTFMSFVRSRVLRSLCPDATVVLIGLQARRLGWIQRKLARLLAPDLVLVQSPASRDYLARVACRADVVTSGVDVETFRPAGAATRHALRATYGLSDRQPVVLHVGHLKSDRGIGILAELAARRTFQVVLVTSSSTEREEVLARELRRAGVTLLTNYLPHVEQLYQLADCYVFPCESTDNAIEMPLSVLEALACDLPVATTRFGSLPSLTNEPNDGLVFVDSPSSLADAVTTLCRRGPGGLRALALPYSWDAVATRILNRVFEMKGTDVGHKF